MWSGRHGQEESRAVPTRSKPAGVLARYGSQEQCREALIEQRRLLSAVRPLPA
jgi:hypothetical protein